MTGALLLATFAAAFTLAPVLAWPWRWWRAARGRPLLVACVGVPCQRHPPETPTVQRLDMSSH